jgi:hypothetical protein
MFELLLTLCLSLRISFLKGLLTFHGTQQAEELVPILAWILKLSLGAAQPALSKSLQKAADI